MVSICFSMLGTVLLDERLYPVALSLSSSYPVFLSPGVSRARAIFFIDFPLLLSYPVISLAHLVSCSSAACFVPCGYHDSISHISSRPSPRLFDTGNGEIMVMRCLLAVRDCRLSDTGSHETMRMDGMRLFSLSSFPPDPLSPAFLGLLA